MKRYVLFCLLFMNAPLSADTIILASEFNQTYSEENPLILSQTTTIELDEDIEVAGKIIQADANFGVMTKDSLIFTTSGTQQVKITKSREWNLTSFSETNHEITFTGTAQLSFGLGSTLWIENGNIIFKDNSVMLPAQITN